jgi:hypothetical protein
VITLNTKNIQYQLVVVPRTNIERKTGEFLGIYAILTPAENSKPFCEERGRKRWV